MTYKHNKIVTYLYDNFQDNINVSKLHLEDNDIRSEGACHIAEMLRENTTLTDLVTMDHFLPYLHFWFGWVYKTIKDFKKKLKDI